MGAQSPPLPGRRSERRPGFANQKLPPLPHACPPVSAQASAGGRLFLPPPVLGVQESPRPGPGGRAWPSQALSREAGAQLGVTLVTPASHCRREEGLDIYIYEIKIILMMKERGHRDLAFPGPRTHLASWPGRASTRGQAPITPLSEVAQTSVILYRV